MNTTARLIKVVCALLICLTFTSSAFALKCAIPTDLETRDSMMLDMAGTLVWAGNNLSNASRSIIERKGVDPDIALNAMSDVALAVVGPAMGKYEVDWRAQIAVGLILASAKSYGGYRTKRNYIYSNLKEKSLSNQDIYNLCVEISSAKSKMGIESYLKEFYKLLF